MYEQIEPGIRELVKDFTESGKPCASEQTVQQRREGYIASTVLAGHSPEMAEEFFCKLNGVPLKIFKPVRRTNLPVIIYFHGGCFISGGFATHTPQLRQLAALSESIVIGIQYRLAPEYEYPAAHDDVCQAVLGIKESVVNYGGDAERIIFAGDSAGAQLALVTSMRLKKHQYWLPEKQILIYPMLDPNGLSASYQLYGHDYIITAKALLSGFAMYTASLTQQSIDRNPELSPLLCGNFSGLPRTLIITAEFDPLRDEGQQLYQQLLAQDVDAYCQHYPGVIHGFFQLAGVSQSARSCLHRIVEEIRYPL